MKQSLSQHHCMVKSHCARNGLLRFSALAVGFQADKFDQKDFRRLARANEMNLLELTESSLG